MNFSKALPSSVRALIRSGELKHLKTTLYCESYKQANIVILPSALAADFGNFAKQNFGAIPLLYTSKPGEFDAPDLCQDSDIRTDLPLYTVIRNGVAESQVESLQDFNLSDMVTFYIGCSFSFLNTLVENGVAKPLPPGNNVAIYRTNLDCSASGPFKCKMIVSMQPVPQNKLNLAADLSNFLDDVHGAPVHYGSPTSLGIKDLSQVDFGDTAVVEEGYVPVFWCCGITGTEALKAAKIDLSFSHAPGRMFVTDVAQEVPDLNRKPPETLSEVVQFSAKNQSYSVLSKRTLAALDQLAATTEQDPGRRGIQHLVVQGDFVKACLALSHAQSVALITGFPVHDFDPPDETDGLPGIISLAASLQCLGKSVTLIVDAHTLDFNQSIAKRCHKEGLLPKELQIVPFQPKQPLEGQLCNSGRLYDVVLASERCGRARDGCYYGMKGKNITDRLTPIDDLFEAASNHSDIVTIAIGDGGNELGMGKVVQKVREHIPLGEKVACVTASDLVLAAGVSNWACYALGLALYTLKSCSIHDRYLRKAIGFPSDTKFMEKYMPSYTREKKILEVIEDFGIQDGISPDQAMSVDGMYFDEQHATVIKDLRTIAGL
uniref:UPF0317 protein C14orf159, mitochondrial n=1 Tax=Phallusia mammillata TaxID=59560 RepID=A0A6F9D7D4_9ASCI|nr:UPF0317 protein C14orf159, mitochondrial [Phallusia mammillata]